MNAVMARIFGCCRTSSMSPCARTHGARTRNTVEMQRERKSELREQAAGERSMLVSSTAKTTERELCPAARDATTPGSTSDKCGNAGDALADHQLVDVVRALVGRNGFEVRHVAHDAVIVHDDEPRDRKSTRLNSSHLVISYAVF